MAQQITLIDDLDGSAGAESVAFGLDGKSYTIDLSEKNATKLRKALADFIEKGQETHNAPATKRGRKAGKSARKATAKSGHDLNEVRDWARTAGYKVSDRGRVSAEVMTAFDEAHPEGTTKVAPSDETTEAVAESKAA